MAKNKKKLPPAPKKGGITSGISAGPGRNVPAPQNFAAPLQPFGLGLPGGQPVMGPQKPAIRLTPPPQLVGQQVAGASPRPATAADAPRLPVPGEISPPTPPGAPQGPPITFTPPDAGFVARPPAGGKGGDKPFFGVDVTPPALPNVPAEMNDPDSIAAAIGQTNEANALRYQQGLDVLGAANQKADNQTKRSVELYKSGEDVLKRGYEGATDQYKAGREQLRNSADNAQTNLRGGYDAGQGYGAQALGTLQSAGQQSQGEIASALGSITAGGDRAEGALGRGTDALNAGKSASLNYLGQGQGYIENAQGVGSKLQGEALGSLRGGTDAARGFIEQAVTDSNNFGQGAYRRVESNRTRDLGKTTQSAISRGLYNTTVLNNLQDADERRANDAVADIDEQVANRRSALRLNQANLENETASKLAAQQNEQAGFAERFGDKLSASERDKAGVTNEYAARFAAQETAISDLIRNMTEMTANNRYAAATNANTVGASLAGQQNTLSGLSVNEGKDTAGVAERLGVNLAGQSNVLGDASTNYANAQTTQRNTRAGAINDAAGATRDAGGSIADFIASRTDAGPGLDAYADLVGKAADTGQQNSINQQTGTITKGKLSGGPQSSYSGSSGGSGGSSGGQPLTNGGGSSGGQPGQTPPAVTSGYSGSSSTPLLPTAGGGMGSMAGPSPYMTSQGYAPGTGTITPSTGSTMTPTMPPSGGVGEIQAALTPQLGTATPGVVNNPAQAAYRRKLQARLEAFGMNNTSYSNNSGNSSEAIQAALSRMGN